MCTVKWISWRLDVFSIKEENLVWKSARLQKLDNCKYWMNVELGWVKYCISRAKKHAKSTVHYNIWNTRIFFYCIFRAKVHELGADVVNSLVFLEDFVHYSDLSRKVCTWMFAPHAANCTYTLYSRDYTTTEISKIVPLLFSVNSFSRESRLSQQLSSASSECSVLRACWRKLLTQDHIHVILNSLLAKLQSQVWQIVQK